MIPGTGGLAQMATPTVLQEAVTLLLMLMRLAVFGLSLGLTLISFQAYRRQPSERLELAFIGFAFLSMGVAMTAIRTQIDIFVTAFQIAETIPFIIGFGSLYRSLYQ